jgi:outer membrane receptor protein involved in Fe transport
MQLNAGVEKGVRFGDMQLHLRADYAWRGAYYYTEFNTPDARQGGYGVLDVSASIAPAPGGWRAYAFVKNAGNTTATTTMSIGSPLLGSGRQITYTPPRQLGIGLSIDR